MFKSIVSIGLVASSLLMSACGPSATFQAARDEATQQRAAAALPNQSPETLCANRAERARNPGLERLCVAIEHEHEANRRLAIGETTATSGDAGAHAPVTTAPTVVAPMAAQVAPQMPRLCAGVDPSLVNVRSFQAMRTESQGFGGVYYAGGNTINGHVFLQNTRFWMTVVVNDQIQTATTGPVNQEFGGMILVQHASGPCLTPAYAPEGARHVRFTPNQAVPGQRLEVRCYARQMDPTTGTWGIAQYRGHHVWANWDPAESIVPEMQDGYCGQ